MIPAPGGMETRVLVVEDEPSIAENIEYSLRAEGFLVTVAATGRDGLARCRAETPDFVILDVGLPDMSGFDVCRELRRSFRVPILFLTARDDEIDRVVGLELGADDYVVKPFSPRELAARVRAILRRVTAGPAPDPDAGRVIRAGSLAVDPERMQVTLGGRPVAMSRYEFGLIRAFAEHPGRVYSRDQLMDLVWDEPEASLDRTVDAHIKSLRSKLRAADPGFDGIATHRGIGYSLREED